MPPLPAARGTLVSILLVLVVLSLWRRSEWFRGFGTYYTVNSPPPAVGEAAGAGSTAADDLVSEAPVAIAAAQRPPKLRSDTSTDDAAPSTERPSAAPKRAPSNKRKPPPDLGVGDAAPDADADRGAVDLAPTLHVAHGSVYARLIPNSTREPGLFKIGPVDPWPPLTDTPGKRNQRTTSSAKGWTTNSPVVLAFSPEVSQVFIDIGTNGDPDSQTDFWHNRSMGFLWFEPQVTLMTHPLHLPDIQRTMGIMHSRVFGLPMAVAPTNTYFDMHNSQVSGCNSLLPLNDKAVKDESVMKGSFVGSDKAFPNYAEAKNGFLPCIQNSRPPTKVPAVRGHDIMKLISPRLDVVAVVTDAQGFDLQVLSSFSLLDLTRAAVLQIECQDLPFGHGMFLTKGAFSCSDIRRCVESQLPHRMVDGVTGLSTDACAINNPSHERNCVFRHPEKGYFKPDGIPNLLKRPSYKIKYGIRPKLECPAFAGQARGFTVSAEEPEATKDGEVGTAPKRDDGESIPAAAA